jgi:hypothetical protein
VPPRKATPERVPVQRNPLDNDPEIATRPQYRREALPAVPDDADILAALAEWRRVEAQYQVAYDAMMEGRKRLVAILRAAGVVGFTSL